MKRQKPLYCVLAPVLAVLVIASSVTGEEIVVRNDSFESGGSAYIVGDFIPGEHAGVRLTTPCDGAIVAVQIAWLEGTPGHTASIEEAIHIYAEGTFPTPGLELALLEAPLLTPGFLNEYRYVDEGQTIPLHVPVVAGQSFYVTLEFANATNVGEGGPSVIRDVDGCQPGCNVLYAIPGGWLNFCIFLQGDLVIRAVVDCEEMPGACCLPDGSCEELPPSECSAVEGAFQGQGTTCATVQCPQPEGACCFESTGGCLDLEEATCLIAGGIWAGPGTSCDTYVCFPIGACCLPDGSCLDSLSPEGCEALDGVFQGHETTCATVVCPEPEGACCLDNGSCLELTEGDCVIVGGSWAGFGTDCTDGNQNGIADDCEFSLGDLNCDGQIDAFDIDPFVLALSDPVQYGLTYPDCSIENADCNGDGQVNAFDIDPFVELLIGG